MKFGVNTITCFKVIEIFVLGGDDLSPPGLDRVNDKTSTHDRFC